MRRAVLSLVAVALLVGGCGGGDEPPETPAAAPAAPEPATTVAPPPPAPKAPAGAPKFIAGYKSWTKLNEAPIAPRESDPHLGTKNVFVSQEMGTNGRFPLGTIVVKEANRPGKDFIGLIAVMRKQKGADPEHNDWVFVEYTRDSAGERFSEIASGVVCWSCHVGAAESDYVWTAK